MKAVPLKHLVGINQRVLPESTPADHEFDYVDISSVGRGALVAAPQRMTFAEAPSRARRVVRDGDVLVSTVRTYLRAVWHPRPAPPGLVASTGFAVLTPGREIDPRFLGWLAESGTFIDQVVARSNGVSYPAIAPPDLGAIKVSVPAQAEQRAIADFLDAETARIDSLVTLRNASIRLAIERFESTVYEAISHGVRTNTALLPARLDWLTDVPEHWRFPTVSANFTVTLGKMLSPDQAAGDEQYPYLRNQDVQWDRLVLDDLPTMHFGARDRIRLRLRKGDLLVCEGGEVGRSAEWRDAMDSCFFQKAVHRVRPLHGSPARFLMYCLRAAAKQRVFAIEGNQSTIVHLTREQLLERRLPFPPINEQLEIVAVLDRRAAWLRNLTDTVGGQLVGLRERRQALITAAVTGEIDVRTASGRGVLV